MSFKLSARKAYGAAMESRFDLSDAIIVGLAATAAIVYGAFKFKGWLKEKKFQKNMDEVNKKLAEMLKREDVSKMFRAFSELPDEEVDQILQLQAGSDTFVSPTNLHANLEFHRTLLSHYKTVVQTYRMMLVQRCTKEDIEGRSPTYQGIVDHIIKNTFETFYLQGKNTALKGEMTYVPMALQPLYKQMAETPNGKTLKDLGWSRTTLPILENHIMHFYYDFASTAIPAIERENAAFVQQCVNKFGAEPAQVFGGELGKFLADPYSFATKFVGYHSLPLLIYISSAAQKVLKGTQDALNNAAQTADNANAPA